MAKSRQTGDLVSDSNIFVDITNDRVGIGTTNPLETLQVGAAGTTVFVVTSAGRVGVGTTNPTQKLQVYDGSINVYKPTGEVNIQVESGDTSVAVFRAISPYRNWRFGIQGGANADFVIRDATSSANRLGITSAGEVIIGSNATPLVPTGTASQTLQVTGGAYVSGSVGIGTTNPDGTLDVFGNISVGDNTTNPGRIARKNTDSYLILGNGGGVIGGAQTTGANIELYGSTHATAASRAFYDALNHNFRSSDAPVVTYASISTSTSYFNNVVQIGSATSTGTASQTLQVTGGAYFSGPTGVGTTLPFTESSTGTFTISGSAVSKLYFEDTGYEATGAGVGQFVYDNGNLSWLVGSRNGSTTTGSSELFRVLESGNIGIGTTNPPAKLSVIGGPTLVGGELNLLVRSSNPSNIPTTISINDSNATLQVFAGGMAGGSSRGGQIDFVAGAATTDPGTLIFRTGTATGGTSQPERVRITSSGSVGIGTTAPGSELDVQGNIRIRDTTGNSTFTSAGNLAIKDNSDAGFISFHTAAGTRQGYLQSSDTIGLILAQESARPIVLRTEENQNIIFQTNTNTDGTGLTGAGSKLTITGNGLVGIGTTNPLVSLNVVGQIRISTLAGAGNRAVYSDPTGTLTNSSSDETLKENVLPITYGLDTVCQLNPIFFNWIDTERFGPQREIGLIAQQVQSLIPEVVGVNYDETLSLDYSKLTSVLIKSIQELKVENDLLRSEIEAIKQHVGITSINT